MPSAPPSTYAIGSAHSARPTWLQPSWLGALEPAHVALPSRRSAVVGGLGARWSWRSAPFGLITRSLRSPCQVCARSHAVPSDGRNQRTTATLLVTPKCKKKNAEAWNQTIIPALGHSSNHDMQDRSADMPGNHQAHKPASEQANKQTSKQAINERREQAVQA